MLARGWRYLRFQRAIVPGRFQTCEPGCPDGLYLYYQTSGQALVLWVEMKSPKDRRRCQCAQNLGTRRRCTVCDQKAWHARERTLGGRVWVVADLDAFLVEYDRHYGWLHSGDTGRGQLNLLAETEAVRS